MPDFTATQVDDDHLLKVKDTLLELDELADVRPYLYEKCAVLKKLRYFLSIKDEGVEQVGRV